MDAAVRDLPAEFEGMEELPEGNVGYGDNQVKPEIGMGATKGFGSDRYPYTVVEIVNYKNGKPKGLMLRHDRYFNTLVYPEQRCRYFADPTGRVEFVKYNKKRGKYECGLGYRDAYSDPSF